MKKVVVRLVYVDLPPPELAVKVPLQLVLPKDGVCRAGVVGVGLCTHKTIINCDFADMQAIVAVPEWQA